MSYIDEFKNTPDVSLIDTNVEDLLSRAIETYEATYKEVTGETKVIMPADKERVMLLTCVYLTMMNLIAADNMYKQGTLKEATGNALDAIGLTRGSVERNQPNYAQVPIKYSFDGALTQQQIIPSGNRVSVNDVYFATTEAKTVNAGETEVILTLTCTEAGIIGNGFGVNTITTHSDPLPFVASVTNTEVSQGGTSPDDADYSRKIYNYPETYAVAGPQKAYEAKVYEFSESIQDVCVVSPDDVMEIEYVYDNDGTDTTETPTVDFTNGTINITDSNISDYSLDLTVTETELTFTNPIKSLRFKQTRGGIVNIYPLLENGELPTNTFLTSLQEYIEADDVRPLTDKVQCFAPTQVEYSVNFTYYIDSENINDIETIQANVTNAVSEYNQWQQAKINRDINPDELIKRVKEAGAKRLVITTPTYINLADNEVAKKTTVSVTYGGLET